MTKSPRLHKLRGSHKSSKAHSKASKEDTTSGPSASERGSTQMSATKARSSDPSSQRRCGRGSSSGSTGTSQRKSTSKAKNKGDPPRSSKRTPGGPGLASKRTVNLKTTRPSGNQITAQIRDLPSFLHVQKTNWSKIPNHSEYFAVFEHTVKQAGYLDLRKGDIVKFLDVVKPEEEKEEDENKENKGKDKDKDKEDKETEKDDIFSMPLCSLKRKSSGAHAKVSPFFITPVANLQNPLLHVPWYVGEVSPLEAVQVLRSLWRTTGSWCVCAPPEYTVQGRWPNLLLLVRMYDGSEQDFNHEFQKSIASTGKAEMKDRLSAARHPMPFCAFVQIHRTSCGLYHITCNKQDRSYTILELVEQTCLTSKEIIVDMAAKPHPFITDEMKHTKWEEIRKVVEIDGVQSISPPVTVEYNELSTSFLDLPNPPTKHVLCEHIERNKDPVIISNKAVPNPLFVKSAEDLNVALPRHSDGQTGLGAFSGISVAVGKKVEIHYRKVSKDNSATRSGKATALMFDERVHIEAVHCAFRKIRNVKNLLPGKRNHKGVHYLVRYLMFLPPDPPRGNPHGVLVMEEHNTTVRMALQERMHAFKTKNDRNALLSLRGLIEILYQVVAACRYLLDIHVYHGMLSPDSIVVYKDYDTALRIKVADYYIVPAQFKDASKGRKDWEQEFFRRWAPEMISGSEKGSRLTAATDIYALGIVIWEILQHCNYDPYAEINTPAELLQHLNEGKRLPDFERYTEFSVLPPNIYTWASWCWRLKSDKRPKMTTLFNMFNELLFDAVDGANRVYLKYDNQAAEEGGEEEGYGAEGGAAPNHNYE